MEDDKKCNTETKITCEGETNVKSKEFDSNVIPFKVVFNKKTYNVSWEAEKSIASLKEHIQTVTDVPIKTQKLMYRGLLKDNQSLKEAKIVKGTKVMLIGASIADIEAARKKVKMEDAAKTSTTIKKEPLCEQKIHKKMIGQGPPDDVMVAYSNGHEALPNVPLTGMLNKVGHKVRLTFKLQQDEVWISTKERTEKIQMKSIKSVISEPVTNREEYHLMGFGLGTTENSRYWVYWVPAQYVRAIKNTIMGI